MDPMKLLVVIVKKGKGDVISKYLKEQKVNMQFECTGKGTVESKLSFYLGLSNNAKEIIFGVIKDKNAKKILNGINKIALLKDNGNGIAFTIPMQSVISNLTVDYLEGNTIRGGVKNGRK